MYVILALLLLGVLIIAHEAGHFWAARACGISVQEFSMGMGPLIAKWKSRKGTQFSIRLLPIGGYCQFYGEDEEERPARIQQPAGLEARDNGFSGPLMNFVIAFLVIALFMSAVGVRRRRAEGGAGGETRRQPVCRSATKSRR
ncbi:MAG: site-2 protease family protein [Christensenellales bacterium]